ncbi:Myosin motor domain-containing protein [Trichostrongylus colubriformis]|uniref:Myosin motor domain-containing protein n=1 Tax=Trichostrongylus colubriformis TaxID=6319 RepID=A0AAN8FI31_TRICO
MTDVDREESASRGKVQDRKKGKSASFLTVSTMYRESLASLMSMLHTTHPHFIRCIIPNEKKTSGLIDAPLVLNQLTCNGVLEGIRICRKGYPNRMTFPDFRFRYAILAADEAVGDVLAEAAQKMLERLVKEKKLNEDNFKVGTTKVFFRAGIVAKMEELRDAALTKVIIKFQCALRCYLAQVYQ